MAVGKIGYGGMHVSTQFDDTLLAHLQLVITTKLRRKEGFYLTFRETSPGGIGRGSLWMSPMIDLSISFSNAATIKIDREWLEELSAAANSAAGIWVDPNEGERPQLANTTAAEI